MLSSNIELLSQIFEVCVIPLLGVLTAYIVKFVKVKSEEINSTLTDNKEKKYLDMATQTVITCVVATNQTYVDSLKESGSFDAEAQKVAFQKTLNAILGILTSEAKQYLQEATGDLNSYLTNLIEATVKDEK